MKYSIIPREQDSKDTFGNNQPQTVANNIVMGLGRAVHWLSRKHFCKFSSVTLTGEKRVNIQVIRTQCQGTEPLGMPWSK